MLRPFLTKSFALKMGLWLFTIAQMCGFLYFFAYMEAKYENCESAVALNQFEGADHPEDGSVTCLNGFQVVGQPFQVAEYRVVCQLLASADADATDVSKLDPKTLVLARQRNSKYSPNEPFDLLKLNDAGDWSASQAILKQTDGKKPINEKFFAALEDSAHDQFPDLNVDEVAYFKTYSPTPSWCRWMFAGWASLVALMIPWTVYTTWRDHLRNEEWLAKMDEDRSAVYRQNPGAMRLVGASSYMTEFFEPVRTIDPAYDVHPRKKIKKQKSRFRTFSTALIAGLLFGGIGGFAQYQVGQWEAVGDLLNGWGGLIAVFVVVSVVNLIPQFMVAKDQERQPERKVESNSLFAGFTKKGFYQYHDRVLEELGFEKLGHYQYRHMARSIYLSQPGNLLVEVGVDAHRQFFTFETITNGGKFLETHSLLKLKHEKRDVNMRFQRRSANHEDIVQALAEHDRLVAEFTYGGSVQEAQFTEERFERFLRWGAEKNAS